jgi:hypothetical protein
MSATMAIFAEKKSMIREQEQKEMILATTAKIAMFVNNECRRRNISTYMLSKMSGVTFYAVKAIRAGRIQPLDRVVRVIYSLGGNILIV